VSLRGGTADLSWPDAATPGEARLVLPAGLNWRAYRGSTDPIMGWYSAGLGYKMPAVTLIGSGRCQRDTPLTTRLKFVGLAAQATSAGRIGPLRRSPTNHGDEADIAAEASS
jgi:hypothetical protein